MPKLQEAAVVVAGHVVDISDATEFGTDKREGVRVLIATGDGFASVKLKLADEAAIKPMAGKPVVWVIRPGATGGNGRDASTFTAFVREANPSDLDKIVSAFNAAHPQQKAA